MSAETGAAPALRFVGPRDAPRAEGEHATDVLRAVGRAARLDPVTAWRVLAFAEYDVRRSFFDDLWQVPMGSVVATAADGRLAVEVPVVGPRHGVDVDAAVAETRRLVERSVEAAVRPARRAAVLLSGGLDSGTVAATLCRVWRSLDRDPNDLAAFHVVPPPEAGPGERAGAEATAAHVGLALHVLPVRRHADPFAGCDDMLRANDLPSDDGRFLHGRDRLVAIRDAGFDTVLTGDGGDQVFGGRWVSAWRRPSLARTGLALAEHLTRAVARPVRDAVGGRRGALARKARAMATPDWLLALAPEDPHAATYAPPPRGLGGARAGRWGRSYSARQMVLGSYWRAWGDALGLSIRSPLLAPALVGLVASLPPRLFADPRIDRPLLRRAVAGDLPRVTAATAKAPASGLDLLRTAIAGHGQAWYEAHVEGTALERAGLAPKARWDALLRRGAEGTHDETFRALAFPSLGAWCRARGL